MVGNSYQGTSRFPKYFCWWKNSPLLLSAMTLSVIDVCQAVVDAAAISLYSINWWLSRMAWLIVEELTALSNGQIVVTSMFFCAWQNCWNFFITSISHLTGQYRWFLSLLMHTLVVALNIFRTTSSSTVEGWIDFISFLKTADFSLLSVIDVTHKFDILVLCEALLRRIRISSASREMKIKYD